MDITGEFMCVFVLGGVRSGRPQQIVGVQSLADGSGGQNVGFSRHSNWLYAFHKQQQTHMDHISCRHFHGK